MIIIIGSGADGIYALTFTSVRGNRDLKPKDSPFPFPIGGQTISEGSALSFSAQSPDPCGASLYIPFSLVGSDPDMDSLCLKTQVIQNGMLSGTAPFICP